LPEDLPSRYRFHATTSMCEKQKKASGSRPHVRHAAAMLSRADALALGVEDRAAPVEDAHAEHPARGEQRPHLPERVHRAAQVLQHLMRKNGIERSGGKARLVDASDFEAQVSRRRRAGERLCRRDHLRRRVDADRLARRHALRKTGSDGTGPAWPRRPERAVINEKESFA
jgi:hypothetical protein